MNETATYQSPVGQLIEPEKIGYSFNTPGWYMVVGVLLLTAFVIAVLQYRKYLKNAYRREALKQIENIVDTKSESLVFEINHLLKIMAINLFGREKVASLYGEEWFSFLNKTMNTRNERNFHEIIKAIYNKDYTLSENEKTKLLEFAVDWVHKHNVKNV